MAIVHWIRFHLHRARRAFSSRPRNKLTAYDATYLELAIRRAATLATFDRKLAAAARNAGVRVLAMPG